jgi:FKBP-type peptidyl-prolyl cis-trans isomerase FkpA
MKEFAMIRPTLHLLLLCATAAVMGQASAQSASASATVQVDIPPVPVIGDPAQNELVKIDTVVGTGKEATVGSKVYMHYTGWLYKPMAAKQHGRQFDSSHERGQPLEVVLGVGRVIKGWDQGIVGMKVGGKRTLIIPNHLAYGSRDMGPIIKAGSDLIFDVELVDVK